MAWSLIMIMIMIICKYVEIQTSCQNTVYWCQLKTKLKILNQAKSRVTSRSPDLMVCCLLIGSYLIYPILDYFRIFSIGYENYHRRFQGLIINMHDVTDICMRLQVPPKIMFNQLDQYFNSLTNDYCRHENCCSIHSNMVAMLWYLDDTHFPYMKEWNLILITICHIW